ASTCTSCPTFSARVICVSSASTRAPVSTVTPQTIASGAQPFPGALRQRCVSSSTSLRGRSGSVAAAALIGIGLTLLVEQVAHVESPSLFLIAFGGALLFAYFNQPSRASNLIVVAGVLSGLGVGCLLTSNGLTPEYLHGALMAGSLAIG